MAIQPGVWGIDLGQCALKALRMEIIDGQVTATAFDYVEHPKILSQPDADPDQLTREALEKFLSRNSLRGDLVAISIPGQSGLARFVKLPPVEEKKITDIVRFEAKQQIPFNLDEVVWDYQKLGSGEVKDGFAMETEIGLFAIKRDTVSRYLQHFKDVNVEVHIVQMAPLALCNYVAYDLLEGAAAGEDDGETAGKKRCIVALDIGADNSNLVITDGSRIIWQRPIPLGGNHFTRVLTKDMKLTFAKAEHLKRNATKSPDLKQILSSLKPVLNDFVGEVQRSLGYFTNTHRDAHIQYMIGLGNAFRLPGLQKFLSEKLQIDVRKLQKLERLVGDDVVNAPAYTENVLSFAVTYGLALQGLKASRLITNLLPQDIQVERLIRAKKPWAVAAAASLLFGTSILGLGYNMQYRAVASDPVKKAIEKGKSVQKVASDNESRYTTIQGEITQHEQDVKAIVAGQEERLNWMEFTKFINTALPKPDGSNLDENKKSTEDKSPKALFWDYAAQDAYKEFQKQFKDVALAGPSKTDEEEWRKNLINVNVEGVFCAYAPNLSVPLSQIKNDLKQREEMPLWDAMPDKDKATLPTEPGWMVEVRGYTYHKLERQFVIETLVRNLARLPIKEDKSAAPATPGTENPTTSGNTTTPAATGSGPATNPTPAVTDSTTASAETDKPKEPVHPIWNKVSHVLLYKYETVRDPEPNQFVLADKSEVASLVGGGGSSMGGMMGGGRKGGMMPGGGGDERAGGIGGPGGMMGSGMSGSSWTPLTSGASGGGGGMGGGKGGGMGGPGMVGGMMPGTMPGRGAMSPGGPGGDTRDMMRRSMMGGASFKGGGERRGGVGDLDSGDPNAAKNKSGLRRTEFIVIFAWREPVPSDAMFKIEAPPEGSPDAGGMMPGTMPGGVPAATGSGAPSTGGEGK